MAANKKEEFTFEKRLEHFQKLKVWKCVRVYKCTVDISWFQYRLLSLKWTTSETFFWFFFFLLMLVLTVFFKGCIRRGFHPVHARGRRVQTEQMCGIETQSCMLIRASLDFEGLCL